MLIWLSRVFSSKWTWTTRFTNTTSRACQAVFLNKIWPALSQSKNGEPDLLSNREILQSLSQILNRSRFSVVQWVTNYIFYYWVLDVAQFFSRSYFKLVTLPPHTIDQHKHLELLLRVSLSKLHRIYTTFFFFQGLHPFIDNWVRPVRNTCLIFAKAQPEPESFGTASMPAVHLVSIFRRRDFSHILITLRWRPCTCLPCFGNLFIFAKFSTTSVH